MSEAVAGSVRQSFTTAERKLVCEIKRDQPGWSNVQVAESASKKVNKKIDHKQVSKFLKDSDKWLASSSTAGQKRARKPKWEELEDCLRKFCEQVVGQNGQLSGPLIKEKAKSFASKLEIDDFKCSEGWVDNFKKRHGLSMRRKEGEAASADEALALRDVPLIISEGGFEPADVYNVVETGLFWKAKPSRTLAVGALKGGKLAKQRITVSVCVNATGSDMLKPLVIGICAKPRCFKHWDVQAVVSYYSNSKAGMTMKIFDDWIQKVNKTMKTDKRKILLLMDNAASHALEQDSCMIHGLKAQKLSNVTLVSLPANTTSVVQPLDAGIIAAYKKLYKTELLRWYLQQIEADRTADLSNIAPDLKQAISWTAAILNQMKPETIVNCWKKVKILPPALTQAMAEESDNIATADDQSNAEIGCLIQALELGANAMSADEYLQLDHDSQIEVEMTDAEIIAFSKSDKRDDSAAVETVDSDDEFIETREWVSDEKGREALAAAADYVSQFSNSADSQLKMQQICSFVAKSKTSNMLKQKQSSKRDVLSSKRARVD